MTPDYEKCRREQRLVRRMFWGLLLFCAAGVWLSKYL
jgi:hypothetical protein